MALWHGISQEIYIYTHTQLRAMIQLGNRKGTVAKQCLSDKGADIPHR